MIRNKYKNINAINTLPIIINGKKIGNAMIDMAYREVRFYTDVDGDEYMQFMAAFNKVGLDGFAITYNIGGCNEEIR